jgi:hypothetical protein
LGLEAARRAWREVNAGKRSTIRRRPRGNLATAWPLRRLGEVTVFAFLHFFFVFFDVSFFYGFQFKRTGSNDFKVGAALGARDDFALVDIFLFNVQIGFAFGTQNHKASLAY